MPCKVSYRIKSVFRLETPWGVLSYSLHAREVAVLAKGELAAGSHSVDWLGRDAAGVELASGVYLARLTSAESVDSQRLIMIR